MKQKGLTESDTIAALATPFGVGGLGVIRISGPKALEVALKVFRPKSPPFELPPRKVRYGFVYDPSSGEVVDEAIAVYMKAPYSYTREDVVELSCHGGYLVLRKVLELVLKSGAREALPGEFTKRAFLNGRIDLAQAEAVLELISAQSEQALRLAERQLEGVLSKRIASLKGRLIGLVAPLEAWLDLPEEEVPEPSVEELREGLKGVLEEVEELLGHWRQEVVYREGVKTAFVGRANVGKSSLFNALLGRDRAIVTPIPGTTTDVIEETVIIEGIPFCLMDMAGIGRPKDPVEEEGVRRARRKFEEADLLLLVFDLGGPLEDEDLELLRQVEEAGKPYLLVLNKRDLPWAFDPKEVVKAPFVLTSALTGEGLKELREAMARVVLKAHGVGSPSELVPLNTRHKRVLERARAKVLGIMEGLEGTLKGDLLLYELRELLDLLGEITGETTPEEVLEEIFSRFCIGK